MSLKQTLTSDLKDAMKAGDATKRDVLRMLDSAIKNMEIEKKKREEGLSDEEVLEVIGKSVKQRQDSIRQFEQGGRPELAEKEKIEMDILAVYLPQQLGEEEIRAIVKDVLVSTGAQSPADLGKVMGLIMARVKGKADGNVVREMVLSELGK